MSKEAADDVTRLTWKRKWLARLDDVIAWRRRTVARLVLAGAVLVLVVRPHDVLEVCLDGSSEDLRVELGAVDVPRLSVLVELDLVHSWRCRRARRRRTAAVICRRWR